MEFGHEFINCGEIRYWRKLQVIFCKWKYIAFDVLWIQYSRFSYWCDEKREHFQFPFDIMIFTGYHIWTIRIYNVELELDFVIKYIWKIPLIKTVKLSTSKEIPKQFRYKSTLFIYSRYNFNIEIKSYELFERKYNWNQDKTFRIIFLINFLFWILADADEYLVSENLTHS